MRKITIRSGHVRKSPPLFLGTTLSDLFCGWVTTPIGKCWAKAAALFDLGVGAAGSGFRRPKLAYTKGLTYFQPETHTADSPFYKQEVLRAHVSLGIHIERSTRATPRESLVVSTFRKVSIKLSN